MTRAECDFEAEVLAAVLQGRDDAGLRAHRAACPICSDVAAIAEAIETDRAAGTAPVIPNSGRMWWLAQRRARLEAAEAANRPLTAVQVIAMVCAAALLVTYLPAAVARIEWTWVGWMTSLLVEHGALALAAAAVLFLLPAAVYFTMLRD
jgi:hypothetical protein